MIKVFVKLFFNLKRNVYKELYICVEILLVTYIMSKFEFSYISFWINNMPGICDHLSLQNERDVLQ